MPATEDGWWIQVHLDKQQAPTITFQIGTSNQNAKFWRAWNTGEESEFDVQQEYRNVARLYLKAQSSEGKNSWFCMRYKERGVKHFDFDDDEDHEENQGDSDDEC